MISFFKKFEFKSPLIWLALILGAGFLFRWLAILNAGSFWFDEMFSVHFAQYNLGKMWELLIYETNPPLHIFLLHFWIKFFGTSEWAVRILSLILGLSSVIVIYLLGKKLFSQRVGLLAAFLMSFSGLQMYHSAEARTYPLFVLLALLSVYFFWQAIESKKWFSWVAYTIFTIFCISKNHIKKS